MLTRLIVLYIYIYVQANIHHTVACENTRFSSLFADGDVSRGGIGLRHQYGTSAAESQTFLLAKRPRRRRARRNGCFREQVDLLKAVKRKKLRREMLFNITWFLTVIQVSARSRLACVLAGLARKYPRAQESRQLRRIDRGDPTLFEKNGVNY